MTLKGKAWLLASAAILVPMAQLQAQEVIELDAIRVESEAAQQVLGNTTVTQEDLEQRNPASMADVFEGESEITASGGASIAQKVFVHGIEESLLSITIDGARQNKSAFHHTGNVLIDPALLKQVEVSSGLAPADQGPGALGGSVAYETKDARDLLKIGDNFGGQASVGFSGNGDTLRSSLTIFGRDGGFEYLLSGTRTKGGDYTDGSGNTVIGTGADVSNYVAKLAFTTEDGKRLEFSADHTRDAGQRAFQGGFARPDFAAVVGRPTTLQQAVAERKSYTFTYTDEAPQGAWAPTIQLAYNEQLVDAGQAQGKNTSLSGTFKNEFTLGNGVLTAGADFFHDTAEGTGAGNAPGAKETLNNVGVFAQMRQDLSDRVSLSYGMRADMQKFELADGSTHEEAGVSVNAAADIMLTEALSLNIGAASVWGGYELSEAALINSSRGAPSPWTYGVMRASRANNARIGLRYQTGGWTADAAVFYTEIKDAPYLFDGSRNGGPGAFYPTLTTKGVDASLRYDAAMGYFQANYTYADVRRDGQAIGSTDYYWGRPAGHIFGLSAAYDVTPEITLGGTAEIVLDHNNGGTQLPGYEVFNVFGTYTPRGYDNIEVRLDVRNVFNETYSNRSSDGIDFARVVPLTEPGRTIALTVSTKF